MKKMKRLLGAGLALVMVLALAACGGEGSSGSSSIVGIWEATDYQGRTITQGKLATGYNSTMILLSDNTYILSIAQNAYYSSDNGETYNPTNYISVQVYGTYTITNEDAELGERTVQINTVDRVINAGYDTDESATEEDRALMADNPLIGAEYYLTSDGRMSEAILLETIGLYQVGPDY